MKYNIELTGEQLQFIVAVIEQTPLPYKDTAPIMATIKAQVDEQNKEDD